MFLLTHSHLILAFVNNPFLYRLLLINAKTNSCVALYNKPAVPFETLSRIGPTTRIQINTICFIHEDIVRKDVISGYRADKIDWHIRKQLVV
jgi:hypothetical protein